MESLLFPLLLAMLAVFLFLSMRKQKKRASEMQEMQNAVSTGARVQLTSGLYGTVIDAASTDFVDVEIATGVVTRWNRLAIMRVIPTEEAAATYPGYVDPEADLDDDLDTADIDTSDVDEADLDTIADIDNDSAPDTAERRGDGDK